MDPGALRDGTGLTRLNRDRRLSVRLRLTRSSRALCRRQYGFAAVDPIDPRMYSAVVLQAIGMIRVQCDCTMENAVVRLNLRAHATGLSIEDIAEAVVDRSIRFAD
jgi:hypothetical protein